MNVCSRPKHLGIIMDGNGRWAIKRGIQRFQGHIEGLKTTKVIVEEVVKLKVPYLSLYVFSTENWSRSEEEVQFLMDLIIRHLKQESSFYYRQCIRVVCSGDLSALNSDIRKELDLTQEKTRHFLNGTTVNLLINYGGQSEIIRAIRRIIEKGCPVTYESIWSCLDQPKLPPVDLVIRTAGEQRLSNFMIWQSSYAEYYFTKTLWPDFSIQDLLDALETYSRRIRKFGGIVK